MSRVLALMALLLSSVTEAATLPPVEAPDVIEVERNYPKQVIAELRDPDKVRAVVSFMNSRLTGWDVPWYGPPVGQVYLKLVKNDRLVDNFYVGPWFFGRDRGNFWSQRATEQEVQKLGELIGVPLLEIIKRAERR
jgi:hypothetical protein